MPSTLHRPNVHELLDRLHADASRDDERAEMLSFTAGAAALWRAEERQTLYMPISEPAGRLLYALTRASAPALVVEIREGDALQTLADLEQEIGLLLLDGWKDLCLPVLAMLEPQLATGALVLADDTDQDAMSDYLAYVRDPANGYESVEFPVDDGVEISCRIA